MRSTKGHTHSSAIHDEEEEYEDEFSAKKDGTSTSKDGKSNVRANAIRSKHSVTEQRRRCKINERFQMLRDLIPHGDHKRDTASFLLEVIEYVQLLQEKVQNYEGSHQEWSAEPTKLMPWRHNNWRNQSLLTQPQSINNGAGPAMPFSGKSDERNASINPGVVVNAQTSLDPDANQDTYRVLSEPQLELAEKVPALPSLFHMQMPPHVHTDDMFAHPSQGMASDSQSTECPIASDNRQDEHTIEGGTISISSTYSQELLTTLTQALQSSGVDLAKARISIQIDLGKRADQAHTTDVPHDKEHENGSCTPGVAHQTEGIHHVLGQAHKRLKT